jgi:hypothetical protein
MAIRHVQCHVMHLCVRNLTYCYFDEKLVHRVLRNPVHDQLHDAPHKLAYISSTTVGDPRETNFAHAL